MLTKYFVFLANSLNRLIYRTLGSTNWPNALTSVFLFGGSWAMRASTKDMQAYLMAVLGEEFTSKKIHQAIQFAQTAYYDIPSEEMQIGLGWLNF